jgi:DNA-binding response OmpR family regulator
MIRILLIEDDQSLGATLSERLSRECSQVKWARTIAEAETLLAQESFSLLIVDLMLPDGSGFDLVERLRKNNKTAVIFLTAMAGPEYRLKGYELGACEYIPNHFILKSYYYLLNVICLIALLTLLIIFVRRMYTELGD